MCKKIVLILIISINTIFSYGIPKDNHIRWERMDSLSSKQIVNLIALSKLYGYARYFYPNQQFAKYRGREWNKFLVYASEFIINAEDDKDLINRLKELFTPIIPELLFIKPIQNKSTKDKPFYCWEHQGVGSLPIKNTYYHNEIKYFLNYGDFLPAPDSFYQYKLTENINVYFPIAISYKHRKISRDMRQLNKKIKSIKFKLTSISELSLLSKLVRNKDTYEYKDLVFIKNKHVRIADIIIRWNLIEHFYPYYQEDNLDNIWLNELIKSLDNAVSCCDQYEYYNVVQGLFGSIKDSHIILYPNASVSNIVGVSFPMYMPDIVLDWCQDTVFIASVPDSLQTLMSKGDKIIAVNDIPIDILIREKWNLIPASTKQAKFEALVRNQLLSCFNKDSIFNIKIENRKREKITICPNLIKGITNLDEDNNFFISKMTDSIYYINATYKGPKASYLTFRSYIDSLKMSKGVIIDFRGYPSNVADTIIAHFHPSSLKSVNFKCPIRYFPNQQNMIYSGSEDSIPTFEYISTSVCFLINHKAFSYSETLLEIAKRYKIGTLIGLPTIGTNGDMTYILSDNMIYTYAMTGIKDISGCHGRGVIPDIKVSPSLQGIREGKDEILEAAVKFLQNK